MLLALLLAADARVLAVLEFRSKLENEKVDTAYLTDQVRAAALDAGGSLRVITRENLLTLLKASGKDLADCEGECEVDTGRRVGADLVISGDLLKFGTSYKLNMRLHDTREGTLLGAATAAGHSFDELDKDLAPSVQKLLGPITGPPREAAREREAPRFLGPPVKPIALTLTNKESGTFQLEVRHPGGVAKCPRPLKEDESCYLAPVAAGDAHVKATGSASFESDIKIPEEGGKFRTYKMTPGPLIAGIVMLGIGVPIAYVGATGGAFDSNASGTAIGEVVGGGTLAILGFAFAVAWIVSDKGYQMLQE
ncbi:MAG: hypothetical protein ACXWLM_03235 [Myxococcales bacterium]